MESEDYLEELKKLILKQKGIVEEINSFLSDSEKATNAEEKKMFLAQVDSLKNSLKQMGTDVPNLLNKVLLVKPLSPEEKKEFIEKGGVVKKPRKEAVSERKFLKREMEVSALEKQTLKRIKKKEKKERKKKEIKPSFYVKTANKFFSKISMDLSKQKSFRDLKRDLVKANLRFVPSSYISVVLFTTLLAIIAAIFIFTFFLFFNFTTIPLAVTKMTESLGSRFLKVFWILLVIPIGSFLLTYFYPSMEKKFMGNKIDLELPFAIIHMSAISGSMIDPTKIFQIVLSTNEYPNIGKEFTKIINEINIYGYNLVNALRNISFNSPSSRLAELFNGLATTITSGGDLPEFFDERAKTLLFEYRLEKEKYIKSAETFMDIYISVVIAAPMILMLLLMMMKISGLGIALSTSMITLTMIAGVSLMNIVFLAFLHLKQPGA